MYALQANTLVEKRMVILDEALFLQKIILKNGIGRGTNNVVSIMKMKRYNICFFDC